MTLSPVLSSLQSCGVFLKLGRVSNLPTIWTNTLAALVLTGEDFTTLTFVLLLALMSLFYIGGMYLNDAFDAKVDEIERPDRPIPSGAISVFAVFILGFAMLGLGILGLTVTSRFISSDVGYAPFLAGSGLAAVIVLYNCYHKSNPISPIVMGLCRAQVFISVACVMTQAIPIPISIGAALMLCYVIGLTYAAKQESLNKIGSLWPLGILIVPIIWSIHASLLAFLVLPFLIIFVVWVAFALRRLLRRDPGDIPKAVSELITGISLLDAILIASTGHLPFAIAAIAGFIATLLLQRIIPGT